MIAREECMKWIEALRAGNYLQGSSCLRFHIYGQPDSFCCLGVLADVIAPEAWEPNEERARVYWRGRDASIGEEIPWLTIEHQNKLINLNDTFNQSFEKIADWIEREILPSL